MKVLIRLKNSPVQAFLVRLDQKKPAEEVKRLLQNSRHSKAIVTALSKGKFIGEFAGADLARVHADLILTGEHTHRDLLK